MLNLPDNKNLGEHLEGLDSNPSSAWGSFDLHVSTPPHDLTTVLHGFADHAKSSNGREWNILRILKSRTSPWMWGFTFSTPERLQWRFPKYGPVFKSLTYWIKQKATIHLFQNFPSGQFWPSLPAENWGWRSREIFWDYQNTEQRKW